MADGPSKRHEMHPPRLAPEEYPPYVVTEPEKREWELAVACATALFPDSAVERWTAARSLYRLYGKDA